MYRHILIPTDGSELAERGVTHGLALAKSLGAKVSVIFVVEPFSEMTGRFREAVATYAELRKEAGHERIGSRGKCGQGGWYFLQDDLSGERATPSSHHRSSRGQRLRSHRYVIAWAQRTFHASNRQCDKQGADARENPRTDLSVTVQTSVKINAPGDGQRDGPKAPRHVVPMSMFGSIASFCRSAHDFRSTLGSGHPHDRPACLKSAISRRRPGLTRSRCQHVP